VKLPKTWWLFVLLLFVTPHAVVAAAGFWWIFGKGWLLWWFAGAGLMSVCGWVFAHILHKRQNGYGGPRVEPSVNWPPVGLDAWDEVETIANRVQKEDLDWQTPEDFLPVLREVMETVAQHYHPKSRDAMLEIPAPYVFRIVELVAKDLRDAFTKYVPASHAITLNDLKRMKRWARWANELYLLYRVSTFAFNPTGSALREVRNYGARKLGDVSVDEGKQWAVGYLVRRTGYYAIRLYSGDLVLDDVAFDQYQTSRSREDAEADERSVNTEGEPLRILVAGQTKAGKSSVVNALFKAGRVETDVVPNSPLVTPYVLEHEGFEQAIVLDTAGYEEVDGTRRLLKAIQDEMRHCDFVILVCSALSAAREADAELLRNLYEYFAENPDRSPPAVVVALTQIDQLRPLGEWRPPYNLVKPRDKKAENIVAAVSAVAEDLGLPSDAVIPVSLRDDPPYNVDEGLVLAIMEKLPEAKRTRYQRCLRHFHKDEHWRQLWEQARNSGRLLYQASSLGAGKLGKKIDKLVDRLRGK
jgi:predicted GTPase